MSGALVQASLAVAAINSQLVSPSAVAALVSIANRPGETAGAAEHTSAALPLVTSHEEKPSATIPVRETA
jgi:hypothetical protein